MFFVLYLPTKNKLAFSEAKNTSYEVMIERYRNAEIEYSKTAKDLEKLSKNNKKSNNYLDAPVDSDVVKLLQNAHLSAVKKAGY